MYVSIQVSEFKDQLLMSAGVSSERITEFSCGMCTAPFLVTKQQFLTGGPCWLLREGGRGSASLGKAVSFGDIISLMFCNQIS